MKKDYYGKCGTCRYCVLGDSFTVCYTKKFKCDRLGHYFKADEKACNKYEPAKGRTNSDVEKYDR